MTLTDYFLDAQADLWTEWYIYTAFKKVLGTFANAM